MTVIAPEALRKVMSSLPTGVTVITAFGDDGPVGMAANSLTSLSLDPPLILFCPGVGSDTWPHIRAAGRFCVNVMAGHHAPACRQFSRKDVDRFEGVAWHERPGGPALDDAVAWLECEIEAEHPGGDHTIAVARVFTIEASETGVPLVFFRGRYGTFRAVAD